MLKIDKNKILYKIGNIAEGNKQLTSDITEKTKDAVNVGSLDYVEIKVIAKRAYDWFFNGEFDKELKIEE